MSSSELSIPPGTLRPFLGVFNILEFGAGREGVADDAAIRAAYTAAGGSGTVYWPDGSYFTTSTVVVSCSTIAGPNAVLRSDASPALRVGTGTTKLTQQRVMLPSVERMTKNWGVAPGPGRGVRNTDVGVQVDDTYGCEVHVPSVKQFSIGLLLSGDNGVVYNRFFVGHLENNAVNLRLQPAPTGWVNENQFHGGRYSHYSDEGTKVVGLRAIDIPSYSSPHPPNNNLFFGGCIEGNECEYHVECWGTYNMFVGLRWEATGPRVYFGGDANQFATHNLILGGYGAESIIFTEAPTARLNQLLGTMSDRAEFSTRIGQVMGNSYSGAAPIFTFLPLGCSPFASDESIGSSYTAQFAADVTRFKAAGDTFPRIYFNHGAGKILLGDGIFDPEGASGMWVRAYDVNKLGAGQADLLIETVGHGLRVQEGTNAKQGIATLVNGTATVANTGVTAHSRILLTAQDDGTTGALRVSARSIGDFFTISSSNIGDSGVVAYEIFEPV